LLAWPWQADAPKQLASLEGSNLAEAAALDFRAPALRKFRSGSEVIGTSSVLGKSWLPAAPLPDVVADNPARPRILVVEAKGDDTPNGVFGDLGDAVKAARSRDTILIRHDGELKADRVVLNKKDLAELTIRPARRFRPVLTLDDSLFIDEPGTEPTLFRVYFCKLILERLEFHLQPRAGDAGKQTVVTLVGDGECQLRQCVATIQKSATAKTPAFAMVLKLDKAMKPEMPTTRTSDQGPRLSLDRCFIRGDGDLVWTEASRPFAVELKDSLTAISGAIINIDATPGSQKPPEAQKVQVLLTLHQTTTYLGGSLLRLKATKDSGNLVPVTCQATNCVLGSASTGQTLIQLDAPEGEAGELKERVTWSSASKKNSYSSNYIDQFNRQPSETMSTPGMEWRMPGEEGSKFGVKIVLPAGTKFAEMKSGMFSWPDIPAVFGVNAAILPQPTKR